MKLTQGAKSNLQTLGVIFLILAALFILYQIHELLIYIFIALVITLICRPVMVFLNRRLRLNGTLSAILTLLLVIGFLTAIIWIFLPVVVEHGRNIGEIDFERAKTDLNELNIQASEYLGVDQINIIEAIKKTDFAQNFNAEIVRGFIDIFFNNVGDMLVGVFSVLFISFFLLRDDRIARNAVTIVADEDKERRILLVLGKSKVLLSRYFLGVLVQTSIIGVLYLILLLYLGVENALAVALICAFMNVVPYLGPIIGGAVIMLVLLSNNLAADFSTELLPLMTFALVGVAIVQLIDNLIFQPMIFSHSVKSHPLEIFLVIITGGLLLGILGMILAVPVYTTIKVISKEFLSEYKIVKHLTSRF